MIRVLAFGAFDPLHTGHHDFLRQAKALGEYLLVVVARDSSIRVLKGREPYEPEGSRLKKVAKAEYVDEAFLGSKGIHNYELLSELEFDIIALGYDQQPNDDEIRRQLTQRDKPWVKIVRLLPFHPEKYKSTYIRRKAASKS